MDLAHSVFSIELVAVVESDGECVGHNGVGAVERWEDPRIDTAVVVVVEEGVANSYTVVVVVAVVEEGAADSCTEVVVVAVVEVEVGRCMVVAEVVEEEGVVEEEMDRSKVVVAVEVDEEEEAGRNMVVVDMAEVVV